MARYRLSVTHSSQLRNSDVMLTPPSIHVVVPVIPNASKEIATAKHQPCYGSLCDISSWPRRAVHSSLPTSESFKGRKATHGKSYTLRRKPPLLSYRYIRV
ncbi:Hypothetical predicted protein [Podarcis lilfordi]|uniref:Uncharacterized protein n=1 Tax=Podarcis lilfordi TaxID=74358 RepID=A0AA35PVM9_9SAUR|nr:Hypothetical predicted protein [Podarcis lilfordi]